MDVDGRDVMGGLHKTVTLVTWEVHDVLKDSVNSCLDAVRAKLEECHPEVAADLKKNGVTLTAGDLTLLGLDRLLHEETGIPVMAGSAPQK